ncbi:recombinase family protein [Streptomyces sp. NPDC006265]|uniref:recombinase family protein n=1 Tax=Streptomyces sp. NPDC006265 TaxID=3156740 RepID=UPI0033ACAB3D
MNSRLLVPAHKGPALTLANGRVIRRAIVYVRVSTARENMKSHTEQAAICRFYCDTKGIQIVGDPVEDLDLSGADFAKRRIAECIERVKRKEADAVVVWEYSRFGRTLVGSLHYINELTNAGGELLSATQDIDASTPAGRYMRDQFLRLAEYQLDTIRANWMTAHARRFKDGLPHSGTPRFGYVRCPSCEKRPGERFYYCTARCGGILMPDTDLPPEFAPPIYQAEWYAKAYDMWANGAFLYRIAKDAERAGVRSRFGNVMRENAWRAVLDSGFAAGLLRARSETAESPKSTSPAEYDIWADAKHKALIGQDLWDAYVDRRVTQSSPKTRKRTPSYTLSGLVRCGETGTDGSVCFESMVVVQGGGSKKSDGTRRPYIKLFRCDRKEKHAHGKTSSMDMSRIERTVYEWLLASAKGEHLAQISMEQAAAVEQSAAEIPQVELLITALLRKKERINEGYEAGLTTLEESKVRMESVNLQLEELRAKLRLLEAEVAANNVPEKEEFQGLVVVWDRATVEEKRMALAKVINHVRVEEPEISAWHGRSARVVPHWAPPRERYFDRRFKREEDASLAEEEGELASAG